jgi:hypothetical protein
VATKRTITHHRQLLKELRARGNRKNKAAVCGLIKAKARDRPAQKG